MGLLSQQSSNNVKFGNLGKRSCLRGLCNLGWIPGVCFCSLRSSWLLWPTTTWKFWTGHSHSLWDWTMWL